MLKDELEAIIKSDNIWAGRSTLILAIGILGEYVVLPFFEKKEFPSDLNAWFTSRRVPVATKRFDLSAWKKRLKILFAVLVVAGITGEYEFSSRIARNADELQQIADQDLADATNTARAAIDESTATARENMRLGEHLERERQETARLRKASDDSKRELLKDVSRVEDSTRDRFVIDKCVSFLAGQPKGNVSSIMYSPGDAEAWKLATELYSCLGEGTKEKPGAGWKAAAPVPIPDNFVVDRNMINAPPAFRAGGSWGVSIISRDGSAIPGSAYSALNSVANFGISPQTPRIDTYISSLPENTFILVIGPKPEYMTNSFMQELDRVIAEDIKRSAARKR